MEPGGVLQPSFRREVRSALRAHGEARDGWQEPVRLALTTLWIATLSLFTFYQGLWFFYASSWSDNSLSRVSVFANSIRPLWYMSFFPAVAFGLAWHAFSYRLLAPPPTGLRSGFQRLERIRTYGGLCVGICAFTFNYRILPVFPLLTDGVERQSSRLFSFVYGPIDWFPLGRSFELQAFVGILAAAFVGTQTWGLLPRARKTRLRFAAFIVLLLAAGLITPGFGIPNRFTSPVTRTVLVLDSKLPLHRGLLLGDAEHDAVAVSTLATYFETHDNDGSVLPLRQIEREELAAWRELSYGELTVRLCELCRLPGTAIWTLNGLPLRLSGDQPRDTRPSMVVEIPRHPDKARLYEPLRRESFRVVPVDALSTEINGSDWLVLKIDLDVRMKAVIQLIRQLKDNDVRRIDLAVVPYGFEAASPRIPWLSLEPISGVATYSPRELPRRLLRVVIISRYVPPMEDLRPRCRSINWSDHMYPWARYSLELPGSIPRSVQLVIDPKQTYGDFVGVLQGVLTADVDAIALSLQQEKDEDS